LVAAGIPGCSEANVNKLIVTEDWHLGVDVHLQSVVLANSSSRTFELVSSFVLNLFLFPLCSQSFLFPSGLFF
jgi:hypothetical protein